MKSFMTLGLLASVILLTACGGTTGKTTNDMKTIGKAMEAGKSMKCEVTPKNDSAPINSTMTYYVDGDNIRVESSSNEQQHIAIQKGSETYIEPMRMMGDTECEWIVMSETNEETGEVETADFDYEKFEADPMYDMVCTFGDIPSDAFKTPGKICTTDDMMEALTGGMDFGGMDLEGMDMGNLQ